MVIMAELGIHKLGFYQFRITCMEICGTMRNVWQTTCHFQGGLAQSQIKQIHLPYGVAGQHSDRILFKHIRGMMDPKTPMPKMGHVFFVHHLMCIGKTYAF